jgi:hypothetical protein
MQIIGIDCATVDSRIGLARADWRAGAVVIQRVETASPSRPAIETICSWLAGSAPTLLALDAPLGWPEDLGPALAGHTAGSVLDIPANKLFRRTTDRVIRENIGRQPLDVGADRIARTAHAALSLLEQIRIRMGLPVPLSWRPGDIREASAIEVYPAASLKVYGVQASGYKSAADRDVRREMVAQLSQHVEFQVEKEILLSNADALDAAICTLAGSDYLSGLTLQPPDGARPQREGWIWVRAPVPEG